MNRACCRFICRGCKGALGGNEALRWGISTVSDRPGRYEIRLGAQLFPSLCDHPGSPRSHPARQALQVCDLSKSYQRPERLRGLQLLQPTHTRDLYFLRAARGFASKGPPGRSNPLGFTGCAAGPIWISRYMLSMVANIIVTDPRIMGGLSFIMVRTWRAVGAKFGTTESPPGG